MLMAGLDGIENQIDPGEPVDKNLYDLPPEEAANLKTLPESLKGACEALEGDHDFLTKGNVFTDDFIQNYIELKMDEYDQLRLQTHPYEYVLYYDV